jgi:asparagine synthase (glutamine-hydrolysing)
MCGIAGISSNSDFDRDIVANAIGRMLPTMRHRGPDDCGSVLLDGGNVALGSTRLAILDLSSAGHQPMQDLATGNWIALNGEIYNHMEVRSKLGSQAAEWRSSTDTETVLKAYAAWGTKCIDHFRGMFAFAIWDSREHALWCVRDRLGIKPFYYRANAGVTIFASEVRTLMASQLVRSRVDKLGLAGYVRFGSVPEPLTLIEGIQCLPAGHAMWVRAGEVTSAEAYWHPRSSSRAMSSQEAVALTRRHLERGISEHLLSDVPVAAFLSGGVDSSIITALAAKLSSKPVQSVTMGFKEQEADESKYADRVASHCRTDHHRISLSDREILELVPAAVRSMDLPTADGVNTFVVSQVARRAGCKVVLSGLGADELFGGYRNFSALSWASHISRVTGKAGSRIARVGEGKSSSVQRGIEIMFGARGLRKNYETVRSFWSIKELAGMGLEEPIGFGVNGLRSDWALRTQVSWLELTGYMRSTLLRDGDAMSMAHSLEMRVPFLDHELVEHCLQSGAAEHRVGSEYKAHLVAAAGDLLPKGIASRKKQGFVLPIDRWMRNSLAGYVSEGLARLRQTELLPRVDLSAQQKLFSSGHLGWARLWEFVVLGYWAEKNLA